MYVPGMGPRFQKATSFILKPVLYDGGHNHIHVADEKTEAQRIQVVDLRSVSI